MNNFGITGEVKVIIRALSNSSFNKVNYEKNQIISIFSAEAEIIYKNLNKDIQTNSRILISNEIDEDLVLIKPKSVTDEVFKVIAEPLNSSLKVPFLIRRVSDNAGNIYLNEEIEEELFSIEYLDGTDFSAATVNYDNGIISDLDNNTEYRITGFKPIDDAIGYTLSTSHNPYVSIELMGTGLLNDNKMNCFIKIPKASLFSVPSINLNNNEVVSVNLVFAIIGGESNIEMYYY